MPALHVVESGTELFYKFRSNNYAQDKYIKRYISGTLTKHDNMLRAMFSGRMEEGLLNLLIVLKLLKN